MIWSAIVGRVALLLVAVLLVGIVAAQTNNSEAQNPARSVYSELAKVPAKAAGRRNPLESDPEAMAAGAKLFEMHCAECHGANADGGKKGPSLRAEEVQQATPGTLFWLLTNGVVRKGMPVWSRLPEPQRWQLVSYIKSLETTQTPAKQ
jgi:mono/diheme cytochrome c family protein